MLGVDSQTSVDYVETLYWKKCTPIHPDITVTISPILVNNFSTDELDEVGQTLIDYLNSIQIGHDVSEQDFMVEAIFADPQFKGRPTYTVSGINLPSTVTNNADTYFNYSNVNWELNSSNYIITLN